MNEVIPCPLPIDAILVDKTLWRSLARHAEEAFPKEACALVVRGPAGPRLILADNLAEGWHAADPETFPRTAMDSYILDPRLIVDAERGGESLIAIIHSHCTVGAYFSAEDLRLALTPDGRHPLFPGVSYVVLDAQEHGVRGWKTFVWSPDARAFVESFCSTARRSECGVAPHGARAVEDHLTGATAPRS